MGFPLALRSTEHSVAAQERIEHLEGNAPPNNAMQLTARPGTHLAVPAPPHISPKGGAQGARPSRPAADRGRWAGMKSLEFKTLSSKECGSRQCALLQFTSKECRLPQQQL